MEPAVPIRTIWAYGPAHSYLDSPDMARYFLLVRMAVLHILAQREQFARCWAREESPSAHMEISPR